MSRYGNLLVEEADERPHQPALGLPLLAEEEHVVPGEQREVDLGDDGVVVADDAGKQLLAAGQGGEEVVVDFVLDGFRLPAALAKLAEVRGFRRDSTCAEMNRRNIDSHLIIGDREQETGDTRQ